jgi:hypothetical protein
MKKVQKVINCIFRYEMGFSLKNSGFSYLYGSISYLFGYENFGCFFLMREKTDRDARRPGRLTSWSGPVETDFQGRLRFCSGNRPGQE